MLYYVLRGLSRVLPHWPVYSEEVELVFITGFQAQVFLQWFVDSKPVNLALKALESASQAFLLPAAPLTCAPASRYQPHYPSWPIYHYMLVPATLGCDPPKPAPCHYPHHFK